MGSDVLALGSIASSTPPYPRTHVPAPTSSGFALVTHRIAHVCRVAAMRAAGGYPAFAENGGPA